MIGALGAIRPYGSKLVGFGLGLFAGIAGATTKSHESASGYGYGYGTKGRLNKPEILMIPRGGDSDRDYSSAESQA